MDLDPMKRRSVTRLLAALDTLTGLCVFIIQIHRMWEYYYPDAGLPHKTSSLAGKMVSEATNKGNEHSSSSFIVFVCISIIVLTTKVFQMCMGFGLLVATFGRENLQASIRISTWYLRTSIFLFFTLIIKMIIRIFGLAGDFTELLGIGPIDYGITIFGIIFRIFSTYWVTRFIIFLQWQQEFESYCTHNRYNT